MRHLSRRGADKPSSISRRHAEIFPFKAESERRRLTMDDFWIRMGWVRWAGNGFRFLPAKWELREDIRQGAVRFLVADVLRKPPGKVGYHDFCSNGLRSLIDRYYHGSPREALEKAGYVLRPGDGSVPRGFYSAKKNRISAEIRLAKKFRKLGKEPRNIGYADLISTRPGESLLRHNHYSPYEVFREAGLVTNEDEKHMRRGGLK